MGETEIIEKVRCADRACGTRKADDSEQTVSMGRVCVCLAQLGLPLILLLRAYFLLCFHIALVLSLQLSDPHHPGEGAWCFQVKNEETLHT